MVSLLKQFKSPPRVPHLLNQNWLNLYAVFRKKPAFALAERGPKTTCLTQNFPVGFPYRPVGLRKSVLGSRLQKTHYPGRRPSKDARKNARRGSVF